MAYTVAEATKQAPIVKEIFYVGDTKTNGTVYLVPTNGRESAINFEDCELKMEDR